MCGHILLAHRCYQALEGLALSIHGVMKSRHTRPAKTTTARAFATPHIIIFIMIMIIIILIMIVGAPRRRGLQGGRREENKQPGWGKARAP